MNRSTAMAFLSFAACVTPNAEAQIGLDPNLGQPLGMTDDSLALAKPLGFPFRMPGGAIVTTIDIDSNGRVGASLSRSDYTESVAELLAGPALICPLWDDINPGSPLSDDVYFNAYHDGTQNVAVVTWNQVVLYARTTVFTVQLKLFDDHRIGVVWSASTPGNGIVGVCQGGGATDPGPENIDCGPLNLTFGDPTFYEWFSGGVFDLAGRSLELTPDGNGGWIVNGFEGSGTPFAGTCPGLIPPATAARTGASCWMQGGTPPQGFDFLPDGAGGYIVVASTEPMIPTGTSLGHARNTIRTAQLGFAFTMPSGQIVTAVDVDSNGRILSVGTDSPDPTPTLAEFLTQPGGLIAPFWQDFAIGSGGRILFDTDRVGHAWITWDDVRQGSSASSQTVQVQLRSGGVFTVIVHDTAGRTNRPLIIGCTDGRGANPGECDLSSLPVFSGSGVPVAFEFFDPYARETYDLQTVPPPRPLDLGFTSRPVIGNSFALSLTNIPATAQQVFLMVGFTNLSIDLTILGAPSCFLYSGNHLPAMPMAWSGPGATSATLALPIVAGSSSGLPLVVQAAVVDADPYSGGWNLGSTSLVLSNAVEGVTGG